MAKKVLIVEDDTDAREILTFILHNQGYETVEAVDGQQALEMVESEQPDVILMDVSLPIMDGINATRQIRLLEDTKLADTPIICLTAHGREYQEKALKAGCNQVLGKPLEQTALLAALAHYFTLLTVTAAAAADKFIH